MSLHGRQIPNEFIRALDSAAAITQYAGVYLSAANTVSMPASNTPVICVGVAQNSATGAAERVNVATLGLVIAVAGEVLAVGDKVTLLGTTGRFWVAKEGDPVAGYVMSAAGAAGRQFLLELGMGGGPESNLVKYAEATSRTDDFSITLRNPAGTYMVDYFFTTANGTVTGGLKAGLTAGGSDLFTGVATANGNALDLGNDTGMVKGFTLEANDTIYFADVSSWNSVTVSRLILQLKRLY